MSDFSPAEIGTWRVRFAAKILAHPIWSFGVPLFLTVAPWVALLKDWIPSGLSQYSTFALIGALTATSFLLPLVLRTIRPNLIGSEIESCLDVLRIDQNTCVIGAGGGSFFALGHIVKRYSERYPNEEIPTVTCVNLGFENRQRIYAPKIPKSAFKDKSKVLIVLAELGTGRTAKDLIDLASQYVDKENILTFALISSETAAASGDWSDVVTLAIVDRKFGSTSVLPWARTSARKAIALDNSLQIENQSKSK